MKYKLKDATSENIDLLIKYKLKSILDYSDNLDNNEINKIKSYAKEDVPNKIKAYKIIEIDNDIAGCLLVENYLDGILINEIFIEEKFRSKGIGTDIIKNILNNNSVIYLWVYKNNKKAFKLYKELGFNILENTRFRYFMKYVKI